MTQEDKELLLKDLCGRLPYGVKCEVNTHTERLDSIDPFEETATFGFQSFDVSEVKPYLRPMSSMTEEEKEEMKKVIKNDYISPFGELQSSGVDNLTLSCVRMSSNLINWLIKNHFNYRLPEHLYIKITEENNPYKK